MFVYTIQPVVKPVWQPAVSCIQPVVKPVVQPGLAGCQTGCTTRFDNRLNEQWLFVQHGCPAGCQTGLTTGLMFVYTIQPVVNTVVSCNRGITFICCSFLKDNPNGVFRHQFGIFELCQYFNCGDEQLSTEAELGSVELLSLKASGTWKRAECWSNVARTWDIRQLVVKCWRLPICRRKFIIAHTSISQSGRWTGRNICTWPVLVPR